MTTSNPGDALNRATRELRDAPQLGWTQIRDSVIGAVRATSRRTQPIRATSAPTENADRGYDSLHITDQVLRTYLNRALTDTTMSTPVDIAFDLDENNDCHGADVDLIGAYGTDLQQLGGTHPRGHRNRAQRPPRAPRTHHRTRRCARHRHRHHPRRPPQHLSNHQLLTVRVKRRVRVPIPGAEAIRHGVEFA